MIQVRFYESVDDAQLKYAVIVARSKGKWVFCKHKDRNTYEIPGGHRESGEQIQDTAERELYEETGAIAFQIKPICVYSVDRNGEETFGMLYFAEIDVMENELHSEIEKIICTEELITEWTYPEIQPKLVAEAKRRKFFE